MSTDPHAYIARLKGALDEFPHRDFGRLMDALDQARRARRTIYVMGNGGSAATASHWVVDLNKGCHTPGADRFRMVCLNDNIPSLLAYGNDMSYDAIFVEQLKGLVEKDDLVIAISGSGNSKNVVAAMEYAVAAGAATAALVGYNGGRLREIAGVVVHVPVNDMQIVEDLHLMIVHMCMKHFGA